MTRPLHLLLTIESRNCLVCNGTVQILGKCISFGQAGSGVFHQIECLQLSKTCQQFLEKCSVTLDSELKFEPYLDLFIVEIVGEPGNKQLVRTVRHYGGYHAGDAAECGAFR